MEEVVGLGQRFRKVWLLTVGGDSLARLMTSNVAKIRYVFVNPSWLCYPSSCFTGDRFMDINAFGAGQIYDASVTVAAPGRFHCKPCAQCNLREPGEENSYIPSNESRRTLFD